MYLPLHATCAPNSHPNMAHVTGASPVTGPLPPPPPPAPFHYNPYAGPPQLVQLVPAPAPAPPPPQHAQQEQAAAARNSQPVHQPWFLYLDLYTRDDAPW